MGCGPLSHKTAKTSKGPLSATRGLATGGLGTHQTKSLSSYIRRIKSTLAPVLVKNIAMHLPFLPRCVCKSMPSSWQKVAYTPPICIMIHLPFASRYFAEVLGSGVVGTPPVVSQRVENGELDPSWLDLALLGSAPISVPKPKKKQYFGTSGRKIGFSAL